MTHYFTRLTVAILILTFVACRPTFDIQGDFFMKDGVPFRIIAAEVHYWRMMPEDWSTRLRTIKNAGYNTITTYIHWGLHEPQQGVFDFTSKDRDIVAWFKAIQEADLLLIVRVGPYITAEVDFGGFPYWLVNIPGLKIRTMNTPYLRLVDNFFDKLVPYLLPFQYSNGGHIINMQIEDDTDIPRPFIHEYYSYLLQALRKRGVDTLVNTLCNPATISCGRALIPGAWLALEFDVSIEPSQAYKALRLYYPTGPIMIMEAYPSWFDQEGLPHHTLPADQFARFIDAALAISNASVNIYMAFGGTNFGFTNGADVFWNETAFNFGFAAVTTSYDFDAPISEAGDAAAKYGPLKEVFAKYVPVSKEPIPQPSPKGDYGKVSLCACAYLFDNLQFFNQTKTVLPRNMESFGYGYGYIQYTTTIQTSSTTKLLRISAMQDRGLIYVNGVLQGVLGWAEPTKPMSLPVTTGPNTRLDILVENKGRCSGELFDFSCAIKGITGNVYLNETDISHENWTVTSLPMDDTKNIAKKLIWDSCHANNTVPIFYRGFFDIIGRSPLHTFLLTDGWGHGFIIINGFNIGRFSLKGPARTLYVPASILVQGTNEIIVFESDMPSDFKTSCRTLQFVTQPLWQNITKRS